MSSTEPDFMQQRDTPTTVEQHMLRHLFTHGVFEDDARAILEQFKSTPAGELMQGRWNEPLNAYPKGMSKTVLVAVRAEAIEYIDAHSPQAWYRAGLLPADDSRGTLFGSPS